MKNPKKLQNEGALGFQGHFFQPPSSMNRILEDFKSDLMTLVQAKKDSQKKQILNMTLYNIDSIFKGART